MLEILFLLGFFLHNLEEYIWLPKWSQSAGVFHPGVTRKSFTLLVLLVSAFGVVSTLLFVNYPNQITSYVYYAFVLLMVLNVVFPHLAATILQQRYAPGLLTGIVFNLPIGILLLSRGLSQGVSVQGVIAVCVVLVLVFIGTVRFALNFRNQ